ncbi:PDZ domain-containing protein [Planctomycetota bacterium]|nr:PDZ domain-containing protein [Planctomycetota bacterium]
MQYRSNSTLILLCILTLLTGCNQFQSSFVSDLDHPHPDPLDYAKYNRVAFEGEPRAIEHQANDFDTLRRLYEDGYASLGSSNFEDQLQSKSHLLEQAKLIKAEVATYFIDYLRTETVFHKRTEKEPEDTYIRTRYRDEYGYYYTSSHITSHKTHVTYEPETYSLYHHSAICWTKRASPPILGAWLDELTTLDLNTNNIQGGVKVLATIKSSPAWSARIIPNNIITHINNTPINRVTQANMLLKENAGQTITLTIITNNQTKTVEAELNTAPPSPMD